MSGLFDMVPAEVWQSLLRIGRVARHRRGDVLLRQGDEGTHVLLLTAGRVKVTRVEPQGEELLLAVRGPREALGELSVWDRSVRSATVEALHPCITYAVSASSFRRTMDESKAGELVVRHLLSRLREGEDIRADLLHPSSARRVARVLLRLGAVLPGAEADPPLLGIGLSQEEMARAVGLSRSSFAAELGVLRARGFVTTGRRRIVITDFAGLRDVACGPPVRAQNE